MEKTNNPAASYAPPRRSFYERMASAGRTDSLMGPITAAIVIHLVQFLITGFSLGIWILNPGILITDIVMGLYIIFALYKKEGTKIMYIVLGILVFKDYIFPLMGNLVISSNVISTLPNIDGIPPRFIFDLANIIFSGLLWPFWLIYLIIKSDSRLSSAVKFSWTLLWVILIVFPLAMNVDFYSQARKIKISPQQEEIVRGIPQKIKMNTEKFTSALLDPLGCLLTGEVSTTYQQCIENKQRENACEPKKENPEEYKLCIEGKNTQVVGAIDRDIQPSRILIRKSDSFPKIIYDTNIPIPAKLDITSTRKSINLIPSCKFVSKRSKEEIEGKEITPIENFQGKNSIPLLCTPEEPLSEGAWQVKFAVDIKNLETDSRLTRIFVSKELTADDKRNMIQEFFPDRSYGSRSPSELARINFAIGAPTDYPLMDGTYNPILISSIENNGGGEISNISGVAVELSDEIVPIEDKCSFTYDGKELFKKDVKIDPRQKINYIGSCSLELTPDAIKEGNDFTRREYAARIDYDYKIERSFDFQIKEIS